MRMRTRIVVVLCILSACSTLMAQWQREAPRQIAADAVYPFPSCSAPGPFLDVPNTNSFCVFIQQLAADGISSGCGGGNYCPDTPVTRGQMAVFIERAMRGSATWSPTQGDYVQIVVVSPVRGGTNAQNGTALVNAINAISDESATKRYLVFIEPGTYDLGASTVTIPDFIDLSGSGESATIITSSVDSTGTIALGEGTVVRALTVDNTGAASAFAIVSTDHDFTLEHVKATASNGSSTSCGIVAGAALNGTVADCTVSVTTASGAAEGIRTTTGAKLTVARTNVATTVTAGSGSSIPLNLGDDLVADSSTFTGKGSIGGSPGSVVGANASLDATNCTFTAATGLLVRGVNVSGTGAAITLRGCRINASGATSSGQGIAIGSTASSATISTSSISVFTGFPSAGSTGIAASIGATVSNTQISSASSGGSSFGIAGTTGGTIRVDNCEIEAVTASISAGTGVTIRVGGSRLGAPPTGSGTKSCVNSWNGSYVALASDCT